jgi:hypothetical protein
MPKITDAIRNFIVFKLGEAEGALESAREAAEPLSAGYQNFGMGLGNLRAWRQAFTEHPTWDAAEIDRRLRAGIVELTAFVAGEAEASMRAAIGHLHAAAEGVRREE